MKKRRANTLSLNELFQMFSTEYKAVKWLERIRWGDKPTCVHCGDAEHINRAKSKKFTYWCCGCHKHFTVKTGSVMHGSNLKAQQWAIAIYAVLTARKGISSLQLSKELGITQKSAWFMLQRIREACRQRDFKLSAVVEMDETFIGGKESNKHQAKRLQAGHGPVGKTAVVGARQRGGHVKASPTSGMDKKTLLGLVDQYIEPGSVVYTDDHGAYRNLPGYTHTSVNHSAKEFVRGMVHTNGIESVWAVLKRGYTGIYHSFSVKHLARYVDEFTFRLNEGNCEVDTVDRMIALVQQMEGKRLTYAELTQ